MNPRDQTTSTRAGQYIMHPSGYAAFIPHTLPPEPPLVVDNEMLRLLALANMALGRLDGTSEILPNPDFFVAIYVNKEAVLSSQIEGTQASLIDVLAFESSEAEVRNPHDIEEVVNYIAAMRYGMERLQTLPLSLRLIREIHERLMQGVRGSDRFPGEFRQTQNWIGGAGSRIETARFVPPPPTEMLLALDDWEKFLHNDHALPLLLRIGIIHAQFETIHPFLDGNGRMGRLLIAFLLLHAGVLRHPLLYLSYYFKQNKSEYYQCLQNVRDNGDWEAWLKFFLKGVYEVGEEATANARAIVRLRENHRIIISQHFARSTGHASGLLDRLFLHPIVTINSVASFTHQAYPNANQLVNKFVDNGILREMAKTEGGRSRKFIYYDYMRIIAGDEMGEGLTVLPANHEHTRSQENDE